MAAFPGQDRLGCTKTIFEINFVLNKQPLNQLILFFKPCFEPDSEEGSTHFDLFDIYKVMGKSYVCAALGAHCV